MRQDVLTGDWISIAAARQNRVFLPPAELDPLAPQTPDEPVRDPVALRRRRVREPLALVRPALWRRTATRRTRRPAGLDDLAALGLGRTRTLGRPLRGRVLQPRARGLVRHAHPDSRARTVIEAWADRTAALSALPGIEQVFPFENRGEAIGVTLHHPHGQIYAYPYITPRTQRLLDVDRPRRARPVRAHPRRSSRPPSACVLRGEHWTAFVPFAARWPLEVHLLPHRHVADFAGTTDAERDELAAALPAAAARHRRALRLPHPVHRRLASGAGARRPRHRPAALQLTSPRRAADKLKFLAGSEAAMGAWIGDVAARGRRRATPRGDRTRMTGGTL